MTAALGVLYLAPIHHLSVHLWHQNYVIASHYSNYKKVFDFQYVWSLKLHLFIYE